jgi:hypothetical protein
MGSAPTQHSVDDYLVLIRIAVIRARSENLVQSTRFE